MVRNIYRSDSQIMTALLDSEKPFLVVPLDLAKAEHTAQCCTAHGRYVWKEPLQVWNNSRGVDYLLERVRGMCRKLHIPPDRVVFGGEDPGPTALNFIGELKARGEHFVRVSARKAEQYRKNSRVSSDTRDLDGVAHTMLHCFARDMEPTGDLYAQLRMACRTRRLMAHFQRLEARGGCSRLGTSRLFLRIIKPMVLDKRIYLPEWMIHPQEDNRERAKQAAFWLETATATMEAKWRKYDLSGIAPENNHLLKWRTTCHELIDHLRSTSS